MEIIDVHMHVFPTAEAARLSGVPSEVLDYDGTVESCLLAMKRSAISKAMMVVQIPVAYMMESRLAGLPPGSSDEERARLARELRPVMVDRIKRRNRWVCETAKKHPGLIPLITVDPVMGPEEMRQEILDRVTLSGAKGLKLHPPIGRFYPYDRRLWPVYETCTGLGVPVLFHCGPSRKFSGRGFVPGCAEYSRPSFFEDVLTSFPGMKLIMAHMGVCSNVNFPELYRPYYEEAISVAGKFPGFYFDTSTILDPGYSVGPPEDWLAMIRQLGAERFLFGTDFPGFDPASDIEKWLHFDLKDEEKRLILGENASRLFGLS